MKEQVIYFYGDYPAKYSSCCLENYSRCFGGNPELAIKWAERQGYKYISTKKPESK